METGLTVKHLHIQSVVTLLFCVIPAACPWYICDQFPADGVVKGEVVWSTCLHRTHRTTLLPGAVQHGSWVKDGSLIILGGPFFKGWVSAFVESLRTYLLLAFLEEGSELFANLMEAWFWHLSLPSSYPGMAMYSGEFVCIRRSPLLRLTVLSRASERLKMFGVKHCFKRFLIQSLPTRLGNLRPREVTWLVFYFLSNWLKQKARPRSSEYWGFIYFFFLVHSVFLRHWAEHIKHHLGRGRKKIFCVGSMILLFLYLNFFWARKQLNLTTIEKCLLFMD